MEKSKRSIVKNLAMGVAIMLVAALVILNIGLIFHIAAGAGIILMAVQFTLWLGRKGNNIIDKRRK